MARTTIEHSGELRGLLDELGLPGSSSDRELLKAIDRGSPERRLTYEELQEVIRLRANEALRKEHERERRESERR